MKAQSLRFLLVKYVQKSETLALKKLYQLLKIGCFRVCIFGLKVNISGTPPYNVFVIFIYWKKKQNSDEKRDSFFKKKAMNSRDLVV